MVHDQRFKSILKEFLPELVELLLPEHASLFDFTEVDWLDTELLTDPPHGDTLIVDLLARLAVHPQAREHYPDLPIDNRLRLHIEVESGESAEPARKRAYRYSYHLDPDDHGDVLSLVLFLSVGLDGRGEDGYRRDVMGRSTKMQLFDYLGLPALDGETYLAGSNLLGVALSSLMKFPKARRVSAAVEALEKIILSGESLKRKRLLCECVQAYSPLDEEQRADFNARLRTPQGEAMKVAKTWDELAEERAQRRTLQKQMTKKFGPLSESVNAKIDELSLEELERLLDEILDAPSLEALGFTD